MKKLSSLTLVAVAVISGVAGYLLAKPASEHPTTAAAVAENTPAENSRKVLYWYDPMSPGQRFDQPYKSPFMDMELVPRYADKAVAQGGVSISPANSRI